MSKPIENKQLVTSVVHKTITFTTESGGVTASAYQSGSDSDTSLSEGAYYNHINWNFYKTHNYPGSSGNGNTYVYGSDEQNPQPVHKNKFNENGVVFSISSSKFGRKIEPGSLVISGNLDQSAANQIQIKDDGYGNLYPVNADITQSGATSLSSSDNYVGNVFYEYGLATLTETGSYKGGWDLDDATFETSSPTVTSENNLPHGVFFKPDGTRFYMIGSQGSKEGIFEYEMSTDWDVSTATYTGNKLDLTNPNWTADAWRSVTFSPDGYRIWTTNEDADAVKEWNLDIAWDVTSWDSSAKGSMTNLATDQTYTENQPHGHAFSEDGYKLYIVGAGKNTVFEHNLSESFSLGSVTAVSQSFNISESLDAGTDEDEINGISFRPDGTRMYTAGNARNMVYEHRLSTAWDITTATFETEEDISGKETQIHDVQWKPDGTKMYIIGHGSDAVHQYDVPAHFYTSSANHYEVNLKTTVDINTLYVDCALEPNEYNMTMNPTTLSGSDSPISLTSFDDSRRDGIYTNQDTYPRLFTDSGSIYKMENNKYSNIYRSNDFRTYITKIGLYNEDGEMIAMASPSRPLQKLIDQRMVIRVQLDFVGKY